jgi:hypothetical protein
MLKFDQSRGKIAGVLPAPRMNTEIGRYNAAAVGDYSERKKITA